jgi:hypothetical protein
MAGDSQQTGRDDKEYAAEQLAMIHAAMMVLLSTDFPNTKPEVVTDTQYRRSLVFQERILYLLKTEVRVFLSIKSMRSSQVGAQIQATLGLVSLTFFRQSDAANIN